MFRRLYLQIYLTILGILLIFAASAAVVWHITSYDPRLEERIDALGALVSRALPPADAPAREQQRAIDTFNQGLHADVALHAADGTLLAAAGRPLPPFRLAEAEPGWHPGRGGAAFLLHLSDGRWLRGRFGAPPLRPGRWFLLVFGGIAIAVAIGAYPLARRLTRRVERLKSGVEQLGQGDLATRVPVQGKDEIAALAESFNRSAARIEELMQSQKMLLANCSHELRTPLARINLALSLLGENLDQHKRDLIKADIAEVDQLVDEILLASRLDAVQNPLRVEQIDLLALAAQEAAREELEATGASVLVQGDRALLRRLIRNLIINARRHGGDRMPDIHVDASGGQAILAVSDRGPGIPDGEREKIFEPFYRRAGSAESGHGSGLGLTLVRQIAKHHGGHVTCRAREGGGSVFSVTLPALHSMASPASMRSG